ncbi:MAG: glycosyltransferase [Chloroflexi bacterium]|nr:glycosyltransferase [Chloroflexota bacterium]
MVLPTYNERGNVNLLIEEIQGQIPPQHELEIVVVDDNSPDGTAQAVSERFGGDPRVRVLVRTEERGLATAVWHGIAHANGDIVAVMDTDFNHDPKMLEQMIDFLRYYDIIIGSRFTQGGGMEDRARYYFSFTYNFFVRFWLGTRVQDNLSGFFAMRRERLLALEPQRLFHGYGEYFIRLLYACWKSGYKMLEVPVFYRLRPQGQSKSRFFEMILTYTVTVFQMRFGPQAWKAAPQGREG